jgi:DMSO/TMAO reductase YedYZ molybdopterin-dependent catalytic subunit
LTFVRSLTLAQAVDPEAEILIAYEMNGEPLNLDHGTPFRLIVPHWYGVASVKWLKHIDVLTQPYVGEFETGHYMYQWPIVRLSASLSCAYAPGSPIPLAARPSRRHLHRAWEGLVGHRTGDAGPGQPHR